ncbi:MAG: TonB-dependent receptor [Acidobacteria bacterium]|nr:TonB-dependent receptor [Acidobacteriota bacterium]
MPLLRLSWSLLALLCIICVTAPAQALSQEGRRVEGVVRDQAGAAVAGAQVSLTVAGKVIARALTDDAGRFSFERVTEAEVLLTVSARGFEGAERNFRAGETTGLEFVLAPASLTERVTVTATRTATRLGETAQSVVVLSNEELETTAALTLDDALRQVAGFQLFRRTGSRTANPTAQGVSLRGVGASGASRAVVLADGVPLNDPFGCWVYWSRVPRAALARAEVLRGGASHLYGSGALGGVVNLIRRTNEAQAFSLEASYGNERTPDAALYASTTGNDWSASISGELFRTSGYVPVALDERGRVDTPAASRHGALELTLERKINEEGRAFVRGSYFVEARENGTPLQINRTHIRSLQAGGDYRFQRAGAFSLSVYTGAQLFDQTFTSVAADRNSEALTRLQRVPAQVNGLTTQWSRSLGARQTLVAGFDAREVRGASDEIAFAQGRATSLIGAGGRERALGFFAEDIVRLTSRLNATVGVRFDRWRNYAARSETRPLTQAGTATANLFPARSETALSPQLSVLYQPVKNLSLTAAVYRAFRAPTLNELYRSFRVGDVLTLANDRLRAERLTGGEAGATLLSFRERMTVRGTFFWTEITRPVANVTLSTTPALITRQRQNLGRTRARGIELEAEARLSRRWKVNGSYLLTDSRVVEFSVNRALENLFVPQVARHQLAFQIRYANPSRLTLSLQGRAGSSQFDDDQNRFPLAPYFTLDAYAARSLRRSLDVYVAVENLFNERVEVGRTPVTTLGPPVLLRAGVKIHFGAR